MAGDVTYRTERTKVYDTPDPEPAWSVYREVNTSPTMTTASRVAKYRKRATAQAVAAILEALADQEV